MEFDGIIDGMISGINNEIKWNGINLIEQWAGYGRPHAIQQSKINSILLFLMGRMDWFACWRRMRQRESCPIGFVFGWVSGGTAARQPAKGKDEQPTWVERFHFSRSTTSPSHNSTLSLCRSPFCGQRVELNGLWGWIDLFVFLSAAEMNLLAGYGRQQPHGN